ncbi:MAG: radical SAM protein [Pseudolabrys sp.]
MRGTASNVFHFVMIKPSHYDDDGYPIQWIRSAIPSNTLACLNALAEDARRRDVLGPGVEFRLHTYDETNRRVRPDRIIRTIRKSGGRALIVLVGVSSMDLGRGCPYQCSFCTIINVQGRKSRCRAPEDVERIIRENHEQNINCFIITDDNFARNINWEVLFDRLVHLRKTEFPDLVFTIQVDTLSHKIPNFIEKAAQAGVRHVFIGLENINPDNLIAAKKRQNKITEYREMIQKWREAGAITYAGYILGFPADTKESIFRDIEIIKRELPLDILEFFFLTPLPGSEDHKVLLQKGIWMDPDMNKYDLNHRVSHHSKMSDEEWEDVYRTAWATYYTPEHARTIFRRAAACKASRPDMTLWTVAFFFRTIEVEGVQPLEGGAFRLKFRRDRRSGMKLENPLVFYPRYVWESVSKVWSYVPMYRRLKAILDEALTAPDRWTYEDVAITPPEQDEFERLSLYLETTGGEAALARKWRDDVIRAGGHVYDVSPRASEVTVATPAE